MSYVTLTNMARKQLKNVVGTVATSIRSATNTAEVHWLVLIKPGKLTQKSATQARTMMKLGNFSSLPSLLNSQNLSLNERPMNVRTWHAYQKNQRLTLLHSNIRMKSSLKLCPFVMTVFRSMKENHNLAKRK